MVREVELAPCREDGTPRTGSRIQRMVVVKQQFDASCSFEVDKRTQTRSDREGGREGGSASSPRESALGGGMDRSSGVSRICLQGIICILDWYRDPLVR